jgi:hypothetical protein
LKKHPRISDDYPFEGIITELDGQMMANLSLGMMAMTNLSLEMMTNLSLEKTADHFDQQQWREDEGRQ